MKKRPYGIMAVTGIMVSIFVVSLVKGTPEKPTQTETGEKFIYSPNSERVWSGKVIDYGNFVFEFKTVENFGKALSQFIDDNPDLEYSDSFGNGTGTNGRDRSYYVIFKKKQK